MQLSDVFETTYVPTLWFLLCPFAICLPQLPYTTSLHLIGLFAKQSRHKLQLMQLTKLRVRLFSLRTQLRSFLPTPKTIHNCPTKKMPSLSVGSPFCFLTSKIACYTNRIELLARLSTLVHPLVSGLPQNKQYNPPYLFVLTTLPLYPLVCRTTWLFNVLVG